MTKRPFALEKYSDADDLLLIEEALRGNSESLNELILHHQQYIFNIALKMMNSVPDAEDATQEILIRLVTNLAKYDRKKARFRTWLYRVAFNHILNVKKQRYEKSVVGFDDFFDKIGSVPLAAVTAAEAAEKEMQLLIEESKSACMAGMIMCLDRQQRLTYIVGELFEINHNLAGEIFEISPENFRKRLSRARKDLYAWMNDRCGLVNKDNPCRCAKKTKGFIEKGWVTKNLKWNADYKKKIHELSERRADTILLERDAIYAKIHRDQPFKNHDKSGEVLRVILGNKVMKDIFDL